MSGVNKTNGGVIAHALQRLRNQYGFKGSDKEARRLLGICRKVAGNTDKILISSKSLKAHGISAEKLKKLGIPDGKLFAIISRGVVISVMEVAEFRKRNK
ncbi:hypothetical protein BMS3Abin15_00489 [bacterium BMS3Abin15]|nr:hypothetical protein BMS3Abin15_00489 [bacterium BMS3Abin15]HDH07678.1 hypothetical protein [Candidatus Moranbacteria bacterium]HDZ85720.1 hypothetical protein [Candidatus Moranbacteria bacterium]